MDKQTRNRYLRRAAIPCTQVLALGSIFAYPLVTVHQPPVDSQI